MSMRLRTSSMVCREMGGIALLRPKDTPMPGGKKPAARNFVLPVKWD
jgi:hypothetical protein